MTQPLDPAGDQEPEPRLAMPMTRRRLLRGAAGFAAALPLAGLLAACGSDDDDDDAGSTATATPASVPTATSAPADATEPSEESSPTSGSDSAEGEWSFTDDLGVTVTLPQRPTRIVTYVPIGAALWDFGVRPVGLYGTTLRPDGSREITTGDIDLEAVPSIGEVYGEIDMEQLVALQPDLIIVDLWTETLDLWGLDAGATAQVQEIAPAIAIRFIDLPVDDLITRLGELAESLGADLEAPEVVEARTDFERASTELEAAIAEKPDMTALFIAGWDEALYVASPASWADLIYFNQLGLEIVMPDALDEGFPVWQTLSWEQAGKYPADIALQDARAGAPTVEDLNEIPTWAAHPAAQADQVFAWRTEYVASYQGVTVVLDDMTEVISSARDDVV